MTRNYGERISRRNMVAIVGGVALLAIIAAAVLIMWRTSTQADTAEAALWSPAGPPCPVLTAADWTALAIEHPQPFSYEGLKGEAEKMDITCNVIDHDGGRTVTPFPVCQFNAPFAVHVIRAKGDAYFKPGVGQSVTVSLPGGAPRCVMAAAAVDQ
jgi:hypothetical protein